MNSDTLFQQIADFGNNLLFFDVLFWTDKASMPFLIFWLLLASIYFAVITKFFNFRKLPQAIVLFIKSKSSVNKKDGTANSKSIVLSAIAGSADLGSLFSVAGIVAIGGAGTLFWLLFAGLISTSIRYAEVICGHNFRKKVFKNGKSHGYTGGPQIYISKIFRLYKLPKLGKVVASIYATMLFLSTFCSLQVNQSVHIFTHIFPQIQNLNWIIALVVATIVISVVVRGISRVASFNQKVVPTMIVLYLLITIAILIKHHSNILPSISLIFEDAFSFRAVNGGILGAMVLGVQRAFFCNESGMGSGAIIHANSSNKDTRKEAIISMITPIVSVIIICFCSGFIALISQSYTQGSSGIDYVINAFSSVHPMLKYATLVIVPLFGISTAVSWAYYGSRQFASLFGKNKVIIYYVLLFIAYFLCGIAENFSTLLDVADFLNLSITIPNVIALVMMSKVIIRATNGKNTKQYQKTKNDKQKIKSILSKVFQGKEKLK